MIALFGPLKNGFGGKKTEDLTRLKEPKKINEKRTQERRKHCALPMQAGSVLHLCIKFEADSCIRSKVICAVI